VVRTLSVVSFNAFVIQLQNIPASSYEKKMNQIMHIVIASILFSLTWHLILKRTWAMQDKIEEICEALDKFLQ